MAKTHESQTLIDMFADLHNSIIVQVGSKNTDDETGDLYNMLIPLDKAPFAPQIVQFVNNNWEGSRHGYKGKTPAEKVALGEAFAKTYVPTYEGNTALQDLVQNFLQRRNASETAGLTAAELQKAFAAPVAKLIEDPAKTESGSPVVERELEAVRNWTGKRARKGEAGEVSTAGLVTDFN